MVLVLDDVKYVLIRCGEAGTSGQQNRLPTPKFKTSGINTGTNDIVPRCFFSVGGAGRSVLGQIMPQVMI